MMLHVFIATPRLFEGRRALCGWDPPCCMVGRTAPVSQGLWGPEPGPLAVVKWCQLPAGFGKELLVCCIAAVQLVELGSLPRSCPQP